MIPTRAKSIRTCTGILLVLFAMGCTHVVNVNQKNNVLDREPHRETQKVSEYWSNGSLQTEYSYYMQNESKVLHGTLRSYNRDGSLYLKEEYIHGVLDGERLLYDEKGRKKLIERYRDGQLHGLSTVYEFGRKVREATFQNGVLQRVVRWDREGRIRVRFENDAEGKIIQGTSYDDSGNVTGRVENGSGKLVIPLGDEKVRVIVEFEKGEKVSEELVGETEEDFEFVEPLTPFTRK